MKWNEALEQAKKTGGTINWSEEKGYFVEPQYRATEAPFYMKSFPFAWPWQTPTGEDFNLFQNEQWLTPEGKLSAYQYGLPTLGWGAQQQLGRVGYQEPLPSWLKTIPPTPEQLAEMSQSEADEAMKSLGLGGIGMGDQFVRLEQMDGYVVPVYQDSEGKEYMAWTEAQPSRGAEEQEPTTYEQYGKSPYGEGGQFNPYTGQWEPPAGYTSPYEQQLLEMQQEQWQQQQEEAKKQRLAQLAANPMSWLQYGMESGLGSQVQPWMVPMMQGSPYGGAPTTGQPLTTGKETDFTNLPELSHPSMQYWARMAPSQQQQMFGYKQARTGQTPEDVMSGQWMRSAPSGRFAGLSWRR